MNMATAKAPGGNALLNKVPEVTIAFWIIKIMSTTVGRDGSGLPRRARRARYGGRLGDHGALLIAALIRADAGAALHVPWRYWLTVVLVERGRHPNHGLS